MKPCFPSPERKPLTLKLLVPQTVVQTGMDWETLLINANMLR